MNLNEIDVNELVLQLATALFTVLDGERDHDIRGMTGCNDEDVAQIIEARKVAKEISWEKKFVPLNLATPNKHH
jgi:hypothetical protein